MGLKVTDAPPHMLLEVYLNDHLAAGTGGVALARRALGNNPDGELGDYLRRLVDELEEDRATLEQVMERLGLARSPVKVPAALLAERAGRLKLNGQILGYSPLSRLWELEALATGVDARSCMLRGLRELRDAYPALHDYALDDLVERADRQRRDLERFRLEAAAEAFAPA